MYKYFDLQLFDEAGAQAAAGESASGSMQAAPADGSNAPIAGEDEAQNNPADSKEDLDAEFEKLIKGKYKKQFGARTKNIIDDRLKNLKASEQAQQQLKQYEPLMEKLFLRYGVQNLEALSKAIDNDRTYLDDVAMQQGVSVEQLLKMRRLELDNSRYRQQQEAEQQRLQRAKIFAQWEEQAKQAQALYPDFDLQTELENETFRDLLKRGIDVRAAYQVAHFDDIQAGAVQAAVQDTKQRVTADIQARGSRPLENAAGAQAAVTHKYDFANMTKAQRDELERRALNGEKIF